MFWAEIESNIVPLFTADPSVRDAFPKATIPEEVAAIVISSPCAARTCPDVLMTFRKVLGCISDMTIPAA